MLTLHIYARLQERSEVLCVRVLVFVCVLGKGSKKAR